MKSLNNKQIQKFNKAFEEIARYYHIEDKIQRAEGYCDFIPVDSIGYKEYNPLKADSMFEYWEKNYPLLLPFVEIAKASSFPHFNMYQDRVSKQTFKEVNRIIKQIRKKN